MSLLALPPARMLLYRGDSQDLHDRDRIRTGERSDKNGNPRVADFFHVGSR